MSTVEIKAVSSNMVLLNLLLKLLARRIDLSDGTEEIDSALEGLLKDDIDSEPMEHADELIERFRMAGAVSKGELRSWEVQYFAGMMLTRREKSDFKHLALPVTCCSHVQGRSSSQGVVPPPKYGLCRTRVYM